MANFLGSTQTGMQNITSTIDPDLKQAYLNQINFANAVADRPYQQFEGPQVAGFNQDQQAAFQNIRNLQGQYQPYIEGAGQTMQNLMGAMPGQVGYTGPQAQGFGVERAGLGNLGAAQGYNVANASAGTLGNASTINRGDIRNVAAQNFLQGNLAGYMNPYTSQVIDTSMRDIDRARQLQQQQVNAQALARGAFGGSRQAIAETENNRNYMDQQARTIAGLRQQGFDTAAGLMQADMNRDLQAQSANQGIDFNTAAQNQAAKNQFALTQYGTEADLNRFNAANQTAANQYIANTQNQFGLSRFGAENALNQFNAANQTGANQYLAGVQNQFALNNANQQMAAQQANASNFLQGNQQRLSAANQFANLGALGQQLGINQSQALGQVGGLQQQQVQRNLDTAKADFERQWNYPVQQLAIRQSALPAPNAFGGTQSTPIFENNAATLAGLVGTGAGVAKNLGVTGADIGSAISGGYNWLTGLFGSNNSPLDFNRTGVPGYANIFTGNSDRPFD